VEDIEEEKVNTESGGYRAVEAVKNLLTLLVAAGIVLAAVLFAINKSPQKSLFGYRYYTVLTSSMAPELRVGDLILVKLTDPEEIQEGDIITFNPSEDGDTYLTHRVTQRLEDYQGTGVTCFITKGDANGVEDGFVIDGSRVIGRVGFCIPKLGYVVRFIQLKWYFVVLFIVLLFLLTELLKTYFRLGEEEAEEEEQATEIIGKRREKL
jgi:signal peptidase